MDRDQSLLGLRPFKMMADHLARKGIAIFRYDKRGVGKSGGDFPQAKIDDFAGDVQAATKCLESMNELDPNKIGLIGASEGGYVAPLVASRSDRVAFCVMLAGPVLPGKENLALSFSILANGTLSRDKTFTLYQKQLSRLLNLIIEGMSTPGTRNEALGIASGLTPRIINDNTRIILGGIDQLSPEEFVGMLSSPCFADTLASNPEPFLPKITCPLLALYGAKDVHVPAEEHIDAISRILSRSKNKDYTIKEIPDANHLFQKCKTGFPSEYQTLGHDISPEVLRIINDWILGRTG
jgi:pimeloyl-ACP methyl ester carboxylesterase